MKNYKLDVVRYNNEDVIATSGTINSGDSNYGPLYNFTGGSKGAYQCTVYIFKPDLGKYIETSVYNAGDPLALDIDGLSGYYHLKSGTDFEPCTHAGYHNVEE